MSTNRDCYHLPPGKILGQQYRITAFLGQGWEGEVYQVEERKTGIIRAAKLFYKRGSSKHLPEVIYAKKLHELRSCPIVIHYHHQGTTIIKGSRIDFLVSDFVEGEVLSQYLARQPQQRLTPFEALHLFHALVKGVEQIHLLTEYHGDIHYDNIIVKRLGLSFDLHLIDLMHLQRSTKECIQQDVYDLINIFYQILGGAKCYSKLNQHFKKIILGRKHQLIAKKFKNAGHLRLALENIRWD